LKQLRKDQSLIEQQLIMAYNQQNEFGVKNLQVMQKVYDSAVLLKEFGDY